MNRRSHASSWQTVIADLSLILFLVSAQAVGSGTVERPAASGKSEPAGVPVSVWRDGAGGIPLDQWLAEQPPDDQARPEVTIRYRPGTFDRAWDKAGQLRRLVDAGGKGPRIMLLPGSEDSVEITLRHDRLPPASGPDVASSRQ